MAENESLPPLFGVYFTSENGVCERDVRDDFSSFGEVRNVRQYGSRVFVNFTSKAAAENLLKAGPHEKYGEIKKGRFGPKEPREFDNHSTRSFPRSSSNWKTFHSESPEDVNERVPNSYGNVNDTRSQRNPNKNFTQAKNYQKVSNNENQHYSRDSDDEYWDGAGGKKIPTAAGVKEPDEDTHSLHSSHSMRSARGEQSVHHGSRLSANTSFIEDCLPPLVSAHSDVKLDSMDYETSPASHPLANGNRDRFYGGDDDDDDEDDYDEDNSDMPPLIQIEREYDDDEGTDLADLEEVDPYGYYQVLIANVPEDTTIQEMEKVLYPLEPVYISEVDVTNVRLKICFVQILFNSEEEAITAAKQYDGLKLRGYNLTVKRLNDLMILTELSKKA